VANSEVRIVVQVGLVKLTGPPILAGGGWDWRNLIVYRLYQSVSMPDLFTALERIGDAETDAGDDGRCPSCGHLPGCVCDCCYDGPLTTHGSDGTKASNE
jgi:hypothetical protein